MQGQTPRMVCLGNLTIDNVYLPDGTQRENCSGGNSLYASLSARLWEPSTQIVAPIGIDFPKHITEQIRTRFRLDGMPSRSISSIHNEVVYDHIGGRTWKRFTSDEDFTVLSPKPDDIPNDYLSAGIFLVSAMTLDAQAEIVEWLSKNVDGLIALDIRDTYIPGNEERILKMVSQVDIFMPSEVEARRFSAHSDWRYVAQEFSKLGPRLVIIKRGAEGSVLYSPETDILLQTPAYPANVLDTTGAGDSFCGGFLANYLSHSDDLVLCGRAGAISSSFTISDFGVEGILKATPGEARKRLTEWKPTY